MYGWIKKCPIVVEKNPQGGNMRKEDNFT